MNKGGTQANEPKDKKIDDHAQGLTFEKRQRETMCQEKKEKEDSFA